MRKSLKIVVPLALLAALVIIVAPRIWVKNKHARLIYGGHSTERFTLYHGSGGRMLIATSIPGEAGAITFDPARGLASCGDGAFLPAKVAMIEVRADSRCTWFAEIKNAHVSHNALRFTSPRGVPVEVMWQDAPR